MSHADPIRGRVRITNNEEMWRLTEQSSVTSVIKSKRLRWAGYFARAPSTRPRTGPAGGELVMQL